MSAIGITIKTPSDKQEGREVNKDRGAVPLSQRFKFTEISSQVSSVYIRNREKNES